MINPLTGIEEEDELTQIMNKFNTDRSALQEQQAGYDTTGAVSGALASLGAAFQGGNSLDAANKVMDRRQATRQGELSALDKWKQGKVQDITARRDAERASREDLKLKNSDSADSDDSKAYAEQISTLFPSMRGVVSGKSKSQIEQMMPLLTAKIKGQQERENALAAAGIKQQEKEAIQNSPKGQFDNLPEDKKLTITELAKKNASKTSIMNQIDSVMSQWDELPDDQKVTRGLQLLKTLNSTEGADAVGTEEAKMLGSKLEFALGNLFNSQPTQFGRDLDGFKTQVTGTSKAIKDAIAANQAQIDSAYGRRSAAPQNIAAGTPGSSTEVAPTVKIIAPNGKVKIIPKDQEQAALAAGAKLVPSTAGL